MNIVMGFSGLPWSGQYPLPHDGSGARFLIVKTREHLPLRRVFEVNKVLICSGVAADPHA